MKRRRYRTFSMSEILGKDTKMFKYERFKKGAFVWACVKNEDPRDHSVEMTYVDRYEKPVDLTMTAAEAREFAAMLVKAAEEVEAACAKG